MGNLHPPTSAQQPEAAISDVSTTSHVRHVVLVAVVAGVFALCGSFLWIYLSSPSDGTRLDPGEASWQRSGVVVQPLAAQPGGLQAGDRVTAIDGRGLESWTEALFQSNAVAPHWSLGQQVIYTVVRRGERLTIPVRIGAYPLGDILSENWGLLGFEVVFEVVGLFVYVRRPREAAAAVLFLCASCLFGTFAWLFSPQAIIFTDSPAFWLHSISELAVFLLFLSTLLHFSLVFPTPARLVRTRRWLVPLVYTLPLGVYLIYLSVTRALTPNTLAWIGLWELGEVWIAIAYTAVVVIVVAMTYRRNADPVIRRQIRWVVFGTAIAGGGAVLLWFVPWYVLGHRIISNNVLGVLLLPFPVALAIAILRYRLFDIDVIINRALVYGTLTAALALVYFVCVVGLHILIDGVAKQTSAAAIVISTLASAILFEPLRRRIQSFIDRRFYRGKYDAVRTLADFATTLHHELDLSQLSQRLVAIVEETMQPASVWLWLRVPDARPDAAGRALAQSMPRPGDEGTTVPAVTARTHADAEEPV